MRDSYEKFHSDKAGIQQLQEFALQLLRDKVPPFERNTYLRSLASELDLLVRDKELFQIFDAARSELRGTSDPELPDVELEIKDESWLWDELIALETLTIVTALQKVGKSSLIGAFLGSLSFGSQCLDKSINGGPRPIIIVGTDQPLRDWSEILLPVGLMVKTGDDKKKIVDPVKALWHKGKPLHLNEQGIEKIYDQCEIHRNAIVVLDAFASLISGMGLDENHAGSTEPIRFLTEAIAPTGATSILLHHSSKGRSDERASNASRGSNALTGEASQIIKLDWLNDKDEKDERIQLTTQGRNSKTVDLVIEQIERAVFISHGSSGALKQAIAHQKKVEKLNERQYLALTEVEEAFGKTFAGISAKDLHEKQPDEFKKQINAKATLDQLAKQGFLKCEKVPVEGRGIVALFKPHV